MKKVKGLVLDDQHWGALLELVGARVVDLRGYHGLREDFVTGPGLFNVIWPADDKLLAVFGQLARMGLPPPELVEGWETEYVSRDAAAAAGVTRDAIAGEWGACAKEACPLCTHGAPLGFFLDEGDAKLVEETAAKVKKASPGFDAASAPLTGDDAPDDLQAPELEEEPIAARAPMGGPVPGAMPGMPPRGPAGPMAGGRGPGPAPAPQGIVVAGTASAVPEPEPEPSGPPLEAVDLDGRVILRVPAERWSMDLAAKLGAKDPSVVRRGDKVTGQLLDRIAKQGAGFVTVLPYFSEVFLEGKALDKKRFEAESKEAEPGVRELEAQLPRFGTVRVLVSAKGKFLTSELATPAGRLLSLAP